VVHCELRAAQLTAPRVRERRTAIPRHGPDGLPTGGPCGGLRHLAAWALGRRRRYRIAGGSMKPTLASGAHVLVDPGAYRRRPPRAGDLVLARRPSGDVTMVKRIRSVGPDGACFLVGDAPDPSASTDSRSFGPVPPALILGRVVLRLPG